MESGNEDWNSITPNGSHLMDDQSTLSPLRYYQYEPTPNPHLTLFANVAVYGSVLGVVWYAASQFVKYGI